MSQQEVIQARLNGQHEVAMRLVLTTPTPILQKRPKPNKWNLLEQLAHLVRYQQVFNERVEKILSQKNPKLPRYSAESDSHFSTYKELTAHQLINALIKDRFVILNRFAELSDKQLKRTGEHPVFGTLDLMDWHEFFVIHEGHHLYVMFQLSKQG